MSTLIIVDDEAGIRQGYKDYFEDRSWTVIEAESGEEALELLSEKLADIAIVDIRMNGMDGISFIKEAQLYFPYLKYVISTGSSGYEFPEDLFKSEMVSKNVIMKPISDMKVIEIEIENLLGKTNG